ncbi:uncharacterized protein B0I36DRAFT_126851 [Microdochium trichocladiopsis]|uniref:Uncharacterized protein n=1 Tax=Microdochium trichocladiopsis TaxID=1682393 RepID=A0A9P9BLS0_9PEZI|nr:uncharacterized protein B0I36DRAFT_126851 [Microdochium trichocladiopsis]KAH7028883.1 hypothetical protein B0I36DRAFT_126851 [Microdochium trichocladiopsis]
MVQPWSSRRARWAALVAVNLGMTASTMGLAVFVFRDFEPLVPRLLRYWRTQSADESIWDSPERDLLAMTYSIVALLFAVGTLNLYLGAMGTFIMARIGKDQQAGRQHKWAGSERGHVRWLRALRHVAYSAGLGACAAIAVLSHAMMNLLRWPDRHVVLAEEERDKWWHMFLAAFCVSVVDFVVLGWCGWLVKVALHTGQSTWGFFRAIGKYGATSPGNP